MSGAPKRLHEEGNHPTTSKRPLDDIPIFSQLAGKFTHSVANEYHQPFEHGHDGRFAKVQRTEPRDGDKRSPLLPLYRMPSSSDSYLDQSVASENRAELRESKGNRGAKIENRDMKAETGELYTETRMDSQASKGEKDVMRSENRGDDIELKSDRESNTDFKGETKIEKDGFTAGNSHMNGNELKEHYRGKRYSESPSDGADPWRLRNNLHSSNEIGREAFATEEQAYLEAHEAVGENKVDLKSEDKFKEKERKKKDEKHRDWGEREKDRNDRRNNLQIANREPEGWERERKDALKDKERLKEREKDHVKRETSNINENESLHNEKELVDGSAKISEKESPALEQKKFKEFDSLKAIDRDAKHRKTEKDLDVEGDQREKHVRCYDKESDDGCMEADGTAERDREVFGYGVQQRRRMLRPRGTTQVANREPRFQSCARDGEGSQGKPEVSTVVYKAGECMQELIKLWKEFEASEDNKNGYSSHNGPTLEIRIPAEYVTATNRQVRGGQLWGTNIYTNDSDLVAVLMHTGYCRPTASPPLPAIHELRAIIRVLSPQDCYTSTLRNNVRSRAWGAAIGCSYRVERCCMVKKGGGTIDLEPCLAHTSAVEPTLAPVPVERTITTRAAATNALLQQKFVREVTIQYNLCNEPWVKYSISTVADKGLKKPLYTSARLKKGEVLYLETHSNRYELCFNGEKAVSNGTMAQAAELESEKLQNHNSHATQLSDRNQADRENTIDVFRWSRCKKPLPHKVMHSIGIPFPIEHLEVLEENLDWEDVRWSQTGVCIAGKEYTLARVHFLSPS
ncbi:uncharacterized protein LOC131236776 [Magnolia sinica]|uniref:uncharacterized protein LOC131236776 n=1 Tax=Magnolia sinica TaxID=86752 RepID=UPI002659F065|nr:uncharacterized protein LOC131236776 [Magnolia sinica]